MRYYESPTYYTRPDPECEDMEHPTVSAGGWQIDQDIGIMLPDPETCFQARLQPVNCSEPTKCRLSAC
jgi:hypothetical protein